MCGIAAIYGSTESEVPRTLRRMLHAIRHRGSERYELVSRSHCSLGANRLPIVGRDSGTQPSRNERSTIFAVLNGEIYNHSTLRDFLTARGHRFISNCDTEILVHGYEEWGRQLPAHLDGMFAFIVHDDERNELFVCRDRFGIKPLYYATLSDGSIALSSEMKAFAELRLYSPVDEFPPATSYYNGHFEQYYGVPEQDTIAAIKLSYADARLQFRHKLSDSVRSHVQTDLPIAVLLSGGVDSAALLFLARLYHPNVTAFTVGMSNSSDMIAAKLLCKAFDVPHVAVDITDDQIVAAYSSVLFCLESFEPNILRPGAATLFLLRHVRERGFSIALSGEGSDELLAGYDDFLDLADSEVGGLSRRMLLDLHRTQLLRLDKLGMASTVEVRVPFLDHHFVEFALRLPPSFLIDRLTNPPTSKRILRDAFEHTLPAAICRRRKVPMDEGVCDGSSVQLQRLVERIVEAHSPKPTRIDLPAYLSTPEDKAAFRLFRTYYPFARVPAVAPTVKKR